MAPFLIRPRPFQRKKFSNRFFTNQDWQQFQNPMVLDEGRGIIYVVAHDLSLRRIQMWVRKRYQAGQISGCRGCMRNGNVANACTDRTLNTTQCVAMISRVLGVIFLWSNVHVLVAVEVNTKIGLMQSKRLTWHFAFLFFKISCLLCGVACTEGSGDQAKNAGLYHEEVKFLLQVYQGCDKMSNNVRLWRPSFERDKSSTVRIDVHPDTHHHRCNRDCGSFCRRTSHPWTSW